jgi:hypothetical protein
MAHRRIGDAEHGVSLLRQPSAVSRQRYARRDPTHRYAVDQKRAHVDSHASTPSGRAGSTLSRGVGKVCTQGLHARSARKVCTQGLHARSARKVCTQGLHARSPSPARGVGAARSPPRPRTPPSRTRRHRACCHRTRHDRRAVRPLRHARRLCAHQGRGAPHVRLHAVRDGLRWPSSTHSAWTSSTDGPAGCSWWCCGARAT